MNTRQGAPPEKMERSLAFSHRGLVGKFAGRSPIFFDRKEFRYEALDVQVSSLGT